MSHFENLTLSGLRKKRQGEGRMPSQELRQERMQREEAKKCKRGEDFANSGMNMPVSPHPNHWLSFLFLMFVGWLVGWLVIYLFIYLFIYF